MINISGNAHEHWYEDGVDNRDQTLAVNCCGYQKLVTKDLARQRERGRVDCQLIYIAGGKGWFRFGEQMTEVHAGHLVVYAPGQPQHYKYYAKDGVEAYWLHFTGYAAVEHLRRFGLLDREVHAAGLIDEAAALYKKIIQELNANRPFRDAMTSAYLLELLALFGRRLQSASDRGKADRHADMNRIVEWMHEKYNQNLVMADLAQACSLSLYRFIHKFKEATGTTPANYLKHIRMNEAKKLLTETSLHVKEVASIVGYDNPLYFSRVFGSTVGMPPSRYKERFQGAKPE